MLKVRTLGAGGGTVAWIGKDGLLKVGPRSSGSVPGPACYGRGGEEPTVTDANVVLGALSDATVLAGTLRLDAGKARRAVERVGKPLGLDTIEVAAGIIRIVDTQMAVDLRLALQEQGLDPRKFALVAFGGAGPLHAARVARAVGIPTVLVPAYPGLNCALGMLQTNVRHSYLKSQIGTLSRFPANRMIEIFAELERQAYQEAMEEGFAKGAVRLTRLLDLRYPHQGYTLPVAFPGDGADGDTVGEAGRIKSAFDGLHQQVYGQSAPKEDAEIVTFRVQSEIQVPRLSLPPIDGGVGDVSAAVTGSRPLFDIESNAFVEARVYDRAKLGAGQQVKGPAIIEQFDSTTVMQAGQFATLDGVGTLVIVSE
jgi:N-methylhydantoinase A